MLLASRITYQLSYAEVQPLDPMVWQDLDVDKDMTDTPLHGSYTSCFGAIAWAVAGRLGIVAHNSNTTALDHRSEIVNDITLSSKIYTVRSVDLEARHCSIL